MRDLFLFLAEASLRQPFYKLREHAQNENYRLFLNYSVSNSIILDKKLPSKNHVYTVSSSWRLLEALAVSSL